MPWFHLQTHGDHSNWSTIICDSNSFPGLQLVRWLTKSMQYNAINQCRERGQFGTWFHYIILNLTQNQTTQYTHIRDLKLTVSRAAPFMPRSWLKLEPPEPAGAFSGAVRSSASHHNRINVSKPNFSIQFSRTKWRTFVGGIGFRCPNPQPLPWDRYMRTCKPSIGTRRIAETMEEEIEDEGRERTDETERRRSELRREAEQGRAICYEGEGGGAGAEDGGRHWWGLVESSGRGRRV